MVETDPTAPLPGAMPNRLPENAPAPDFDPKTVAKDLLRTTRAGALATLDRNTGHPFASLVNVATDSDGSPLILISKLSTHTANLEVDARASLLLAATGKGDPLAHPRLTLLGSFTQLARDDAPGAACTASLSGAPSEVGALRRLRRFLVLAARRCVGSSQRRLRPRRRSERRRRADKCRRSGKFARDRSQCG